MANSSLYERLKKAEQRTKNTGTSLSSNTKVQKTLYDRLKASEQYTAIGLDTFDSDLKAVYDNYSAIDGWRDAETMAGQVSSAKSMLDRANAYKKYYEGKDAEYDSTDIDAVIESLTGINDWLTNQSVAFGAYSDADSYNAQAKKYADDYALFGNMSSDEISEYIDRWNADNEARNVGIDKEIDRLKGFIGEYRTFLGDGTHTSDAFREELGFGSQDYFPDGEVGDRKGFNDKIAEVEAELERRIEELEAGKMTENAAALYYYYKKLYEELGAEGYTSDQKGDFDNSGRDGKLLSSFDYALMMGEEAVDNMESAQRLATGAYTDYGATGYKEITDEEKSLYLYLRDNVGEEAARGYFNYLYNANNDYNMALAARVGKTRSEAKSDFEKILGSVGTGLESWAMGMARGVNSLFSDKPIPTQPFEYESSFTRESFDDSFWKKALYDAGVSIGNMAPSVLATALTGNILGAAGASAKVMTAANLATSAATFGTSIYGNAYNEALLAGHGKEQAALYGIFTASAEVALQHVLGGIPGIGQHLTGDFIAELANRTSNVLLKVTARLAGDAVGEFTEEYLQEILGQVFKNTILGENGEIKLVSEEALYAGFLGALTSGGLNIPTSAFEYAGYKGTGKSYSGDIETLIKAGLEAAPDTEAYKFAEILQGKVGEGKKITNAQKGYLAQSIFEAVREGKSGIKYDFGVTQEELNEYVDKAATKENTEDYKKYAQAEQRLIDDVKDDIDISGYSHALRDNDIRHIWNSHGKENEKYPVTKEDIKLIPYIVKNYDKVFYFSKGNGRNGIMYVKVAPHGLVYYLEQATTVYGNEPLLVNKQMIKTGIEDIPNIKGLKDAINKKQSESEFLTDLQQIHQVYAQSVYQSHSAKRSTTHYGVSRPVGDAIQNASSTNSIPQNFEKSTGNSQKGESEIIPELMAAARGENVGESVQSEVIPELWEAAGGTRTAQETTESAETSKRTAKAENTAESEIEGVGEAETTAEQDEYVDDKKKLTSAVKALGKGTQIAEVYNNENDGKGRTEKQNVSVYVNDYKVVRAVAASGHSADAIRRMDIGGSLTSAQFDAAVREGHASVTKDGRLVEAEKNISDGAQRRQGKIYFNGMQGAKRGKNSLYLPASGINENWRRNQSLSADQVAALEFIEGVLAPMGVDVVLYSSAKDRRIPNGMYDGNRIYIDIEAGMTARARQTYIMYAIAHELTHMAERLSPELWQRYADAVLDILAQEDGKTVAELIRERQNEHEQAELERLKRVYYNSINKRTAELKAAGKSKSEIERAIKEYLNPKIGQLDEAGAIKEIVADASQLILTRSSNFAEKLKAKDEGLFEKIIALAKKAIEKIREALSGLATPNDGVSAAVEQHLDELTEYFDEMLADTLYKAGYTNATEFNEVGTVQNMDRREESESDEEIQKRKIFEDNVDKILQHNFPRGNLVRVTKTPDFYADIGLKFGLPISTTARHIYDACQEKDRKYHQHGLTPEQIKKLPDEIANPVMVFDDIDENNKIVPNTIIIVTGLLDQDKSPVIVPILSNDKRKVGNIEINTNAIKSCYGRDDFSKYLKKFINNDAILYINKEKAEQLATGSSAAWLEELKSYSFNTIIHKSRAIVNTFSENSSNTQKFQTQNRRMVGETDREVLSKVLLEGAVGSEDEFILLEEYREDLEAYNEIEREMRSLTSEINHLKASTESEQHKDQRLEEAYSRRKELRDTLTRIDSNLLNIEAMSPIRRLIMQEREKTRKAKNRLSHTRESYDKSLKKRELQMREKQLEREHKRQERNMRATYLARAERALSRIYRRLANPTKNDHIPSELMPFVKTLFDTIDVSHHFAEIEKLEEKLAAQTARINELMAEGADAATIAAQEQYAADLMERIKKLEGTAHNMTWKERMGTLTKMISKVEEVQNSSGIYADFAPGLAEKIQRSLDVFTDQPNITRLFDAEPEQLRTYAEALESISHSIIEAGKLYANKRASSIAVLGDHAIDEFSYAKKEEAKSKLLEKPRTLYGIDSLNPAYFGHKLGTATESVISELYDGFYATIANVRIIDEFSDRLKQKYKVGDFTGKNEKLHDIMLEGGGHVGLTTSQLMTVYALHDRPQAQKHLYGKGIKVFRGDINEAARKTTSLKDRAIDEGKRLFGKGKPDLNEELEKLLGGLGVHEVSPKDIDAMIGELTAEQRECVKEMKKFLKEVIAPMGNKTTQTLYLYDMFNEENYFPIESDKTFIKLNEKDSKNGDISARSVFSILNKGFTKPVQENAGNPIIIRDIFDVFMEHCFDMANYGGLGVAVSDTIKWLNYKNDKKSLRGEMEQAYGKTAEKYIRNLLMSIEGELKGTDGAKLINKFIRNAKIAAVAANLRVVLLQPTAYVRAGMVLKGKNLVAALRHKPMIKEAQEHSELMYYKMLGFYDMNTSASLLEKLKDDQSTADKVREKSTALAGKMDEITWGCIWRACRYEVDDEIREKSLDIRKDSEEYFAKVRDKFHEVINFTQVIDSPMHKNKLMSDPDTGMKQLTAFMAEPMLTYDMMMSAVEDCMKKKPGAVKQLRRAFIVYSLSIAFQAALGGLADAARDDDDEEHWLEKYGEAILKNMTGFDLDSPELGEVLAGDWNPFNNVPIIKEFFSLLEGYEPTRMDLQGMEKLVYAANEVQKIFTDSGEFDYKAFYSLCQAMSTVSGIPISNIVRTVKSAYNTFLAWFGLNEK